MCACVGVCMCVCVGFIYYMYMNAYKYVYVYFYIHELLFSHPRLFCNPMDCSLPGSSVHGISQARVVEWVWVAMYLTRGSSQPREQTYVSCIDR